MTERLTRQKAYEDLSKWLELSDCIWKEFDVDDPEGEEIQLAAIKVMRFFKKRFNNTLGEE